jgi:hypothetical protein
MTTYTTYDTVGIKEDVDDIISNITPTKTPFQSLIGGGTTKNRYFEWLEDSLRAVQDNAVVEGADATAATLTPPTLKSNYTQIFEKTIQVSGSEDAMDQYGRRNETAYQLAKGMAEVKRDLEHALVGVSQAAVAGDSSTTARRTASADQMFDVGVTITDGTAAALTEQNILDCGEAAYNAGGEPNVLMIKPADAQIVAGFTGAAGRYRTFDGANGKTVVNVVDLYVSPYGEYKVVLNRFQLTSEALLLDPSMWSLVKLRPWFRSPLAKTGDSTKNQILGEMGLKNRNFSGSGIIKNIL